MWQLIETAPVNVAVLTYGFGYEVAHYNTDQGAWVACWDHRTIKEPMVWTELPPPPGASSRTTGVFENGQA